MISVYVSLGSNLGNSLLHVLTAQQQLAQIPDTDCIAHSTCYRTKPLGGLQQPDYINSVSHLRSSLDARALLEHFQRIENQQGRQRGKNRWQSRTLDLDLLLYGDKIITDSQLTVPHYAIEQRNFVVFPMLELNPEITVPGVGKAADIARRLNQDDLVAVTAEEIAMASSSIDDNHSQTAEPQGEDGKKQA